MNLYCNRLSPLQKEKLDKNIEIIKNTIDTELNTKSIAIGLTLTFDVLDSLIEEAKKTSNSEKVEQLYLHAGCLSIVVSAAYKYMTELEKKEGKNEEKR